MRFFPAALAALVAAAPLAAEPPARHKPDDYTSDAGRYRVRFPDKPSVETKDIATAAGALRVTTEKVNVSRHLTLAVTFTDYPDEFRDATAKTLLDGVRDGLKGVDGTVSADAELLLGPDGAGVPGRDVTITAKNNVIRCRAVLAGRRLYQVMATGTTGKDGPTGKPADEFIKSFELAK